MSQWDFILDTNLADNPVMITAKAFSEGMKQAVNRPFSVVPYFDAGPWGGQWMKEMFDLDKNSENYAWCFNCVPEENSLFLKFGETLKKAQTINADFNASTYIKTWPAKKHDHFLIPAGTIHCSAKGCMVLEISATPYIFTFKLWDWGRLGLDGNPRPINIEHGLQNIQWNRDENWVRENLVDRIDELAKGDGWREERTGLHELEFIETRRHWFTKPALHNTNDGVNVLVLVEGREAIVESPTGSFDPFVVHYAETFIVPATVGEYTIRPYGESEGKECATIKAYVRVNG